MNSDQNRLRAFADVVSVDVWHQEFSNDCRQAELKADIVFSEGRIGGEDDSSVQFRLKLKKATLVLIVPETEPVSIVRESVRRGYSNDASEWSTETVQTTEVAKSAKVGVTASLKDISASADLAAAGKTERTRTHREKLSGRSENIKTIFRYNNIDETFTWVIEADSSEYLIGRPWDPLISPLVTLRDERSNSSKGIAPSVRVAVKCLREDIVISDIVINDELSFKDKIMGNSEKIKLRAAEAYIRTKLFEVGLEVGNLENAFSVVTLLDVSAKSE